MKATRENGEWRVDGIPGIHAGTKVAAGSLDTVCKKLVELNLDPEELAVVYPSAELAEKVTAWVGSDRVIREETLKRDKDTDAIVAELYEAGWGLHDIGFAIERSRESARRMLYKAGVELRPSPSAKKADV